MSNGGRVLAVARDGGHRFSKQPVSEILLLAGQGVEGDAHCGVTVRHRSRVAVDPGQPNLRQVHLIHEELFAELAGKGFLLGAADLGENITTTKVDLLALPRGTVLRIGEETILELTGLRNPCAQIDQFMPGLLAAVVGKGVNGELIRKSGVMAVVRSGGIVRPGDRIQIGLPNTPHIPLDRV